MLGVDSPLEDCGISAPGVTRFLVEIAAVVASLAGGVLVGLKAYRCIVENSFKLL